MSKGIKQKTRKIVNKIVRYYKPEKVFLFGSYAWGKPTKDSDIDLLLIKDTRVNKHKIQIFLGEILFGCGLPVDTLVYTPKEIERRIKLNDFFIRNIIKKGKMLYEKKK